MLTQEIRQKLSKIYELVKRGGTDGEKVAAQKALDKLISKYNLEGLDLEAIDKQRYSFRYATMMDMGLFTLLLKRLIADQSVKASAYRDLRQGKAISIELTYLDYVTLEAAYGYFKKHMRMQWVKFCAPEIKRKRKAKTKNARRKELQDLFFTKYAISSNLIDDDDLVDVSQSEMSDQEKADRYRLRAVEGGHYNQQMTNGVLLD